MKAANDNGKPVVGMALAIMDAPPEWQMVYIASHRHYIKIGSSKNPNRRMQELQGQYIYPFAILATFYGSEGLERCLHRHFIAQSVGSEFFNREGPLAQWIDAGCPDHLPRSLWGDVRVAA